MIDQVLPELWITLWPSFPHFQGFASDQRITAIRLNWAKIKSRELVYELQLLEQRPSTTPLYFDVKGRQLRVTEVNFNPRYLDLKINHPIQVETPTGVLFKGGKDAALLERIEEDGTRLIFAPGDPIFIVTPGDSLTIRDHSLQVIGPTFSREELEKIEIVKNAGFRRFFLSYTHNQQEIDELLELVGSEAQIMVKIENLAGLNFVRDDFSKQPNLILVAALGDLYLEIDRPHQIIDALRLIISRDPEALVGSRLLLSLTEEPVPSCADLMQLAWLRDIGFKRMMLCDEICLRPQLLANAINVFDQWRNGIK